MSISSLFSSLESIGFSGSRSPSPEAIAALSSVLPLVPPSVPVSVGCADGVDQLVRRFFIGSDRLSVFSVSSGQFGEGRSAFARRSAAMVESICPDGLLVALPSSSVCPEGVKPRKSFQGAGSGTWGSVAYTLGQGCKILLFVSSPPCWGGVEWSAVSDGWWLGCPVVVAQLSLF